MTIELSTNLGISIFMSAILIQCWQPHGKRQYITQKNKVYFARASLEVAAENHHKSWFSLKSYNTISTE
jgi:hypothetical protein